MKEKKIPPITYLPWQANKMLMKLYTTMTFAFSSPYPPNHKVELSERMTINPCCRVEKNSNLDYREGDWGINKNREVVKEEVLEGISLHNWSMIKTFYRGLFEETSYSKAKSKKNIYTLFCVIK